MDELVDLHLIENLENEEMREENHRINNIFRNPFDELNNEQFRKMFRLTKQLCEYLILSLEPYIKPKVRNTDLIVTNKNYTLQLRFYEEHNFPGVIGVCGLYPHCHISSKSATILNIRNISM
ncbi:hypothetical protein NQ317_006898 [Molorchus minor]|uniref:Uncharacterized protein n=1 Tax=Molorchus minor TaxID=1323400 RepID=A0ABQ9IUR1_9CUCU|nr:hypothetical protein NQ317_006898 [Molorchus minor]